MKNLLIVLCLTLLSGCASVTKVESGPTTIGDKLGITLDGAWNHISAPGLGPAQIWTMEGLPVDQLMIYAGLKDGEAIHAERPGSSEKKVFQFRATMQPDEIAALFDGMLTRDGSNFKLLKLAPATFGGSKGFRFDYSLTRKTDNVQLTGVGFGAVSKGELFALVYMAPRLAFFARHSGRVEQIAGSAMIKN